MLFTLYFLQFFCLFLAPSFTDSFHPYPLSHITLGTSEAALMSYLIGPRSSVTPTCNGQEQPCCAFCGIGVPTRHCKYISVGLLPVSARPSVYVCVRTSTYRHHTSLKFCTTFTSFLAELLLRAHERRPTLERFIKPPCSLPAYLNSWSEDSPTPILQNHAHIRK